MQRSLPAGLGLAIPRDSRNREAKFRGADIVVGATRTGREIGRGRFFLQATILCRKRKMRVFRGSADQKEAFENRRKIRWLKDLLETGVRPSSLVSATVIPGQPTLYLVEAKEARP